MTAWDFLSDFMKHNGIAWSLAIVFAGGFVWLIAHPAVGKEWNVQITTWIAGIVPKRRKKAYEKRLDLTIDSAKAKFSEAAPKFMQRFLPYSLKVKWVDEAETIESFKIENQVVIYVPTYNKEAQQAVGILHNYCAMGFAEKAKVYMPTETCRASDLIITQKLVQFAGHGVYDYYCREYLPEIIKRDKSYAIMFERLKKVDVDGLFLPVLLNEIDKYSNMIYPSSPTDETTNTILHLIDFVYKIAARQSGEKVDLSFCEGEVKIRIILAVSDITTNIMGIVYGVETDIKSRKYNTLYVLATGSKITYAMQIANMIRTRNAQEIDDPIETHYKRYTRRISGSDSICYEINIQ